MAVRQVITKLSKVDPKDLTINGIDKVNQIIDTVNVLVEVVNRDLVDRDDYGQSGQPNPPDDWDIPAKCLQPDHDIQWDGNLYVCNKCGAKYKETL